MSLIPDTITTTASLHISWAFRHKSRPEEPGMVMSVSIRLNEFCDNSSAASLPPAAVVHWYLAPRWVARSLRIGSSSSTIKMELLAVVIASFLVHKVSPAGWRAEQPY